MEKRAASFQVTIEPAVFLLCLSAIIPSVLIQNIYLDKVCLVNLGFNATVCQRTADGNSSSDDASVNGQVQSYVSNLNIYNTIINCVPSTLFVLFLGPWSDTYGRKPLMILSIVGYVLSTLIYMANCYWNSWPAEYLLLASVPVSLLGGWSTFGMAINSYLVDTTTEENRTTKMSVFGGISMAAGPIGNFVSGYIYKYGGYWAILSTSLGLVVFSLAYFIFFVRESRPRQEGSRFEVSTIIRNVWKCFKVTFKPRVERKRICLLLIMLCLLVFAGAPTGVAYLYARLKFGWDATDFALYLTAYFSILIFGSLIVVPLLKLYFGVSDWAIGMAGLVGNGATCLFVAFATSGLMFYTSTIGLLLTCGIEVVIRSILSSMVDSDELGHIYAVLASLESITPLIASAGVNLIYKATLEVFPGCVFAIASSIFFVLTLLFGFTFSFQRKDQ